MWEGARVLGSQIHCCGLTTRRFWGSNPLPGNTHILFVWCYYFLSVSAWVLPRHFCFLSSSENTWDTLVMLAQSGDHIPQTKNQAKFEHSFKNITFLVSAHSETCKCHSTSGSLSAHFERSRVLQPDLAAEILAVKVEIGLNQNCLWMWTQISSRKRSQRLLSSAHASLAKQPHNFVNQLNTPHWAASRCLNGCRISLEFTHSNCPKLLLLAQCAINHSLLFSDCYCSFQIL